MSSVEDFREGDDVIHRSRGHGIIERIHNDCVYVKFDDYPDKVSAAYDREWFRIHPELLARAIQQKN